MDFTKLLLDKRGYNTTFVIIDRLSKKLISIPYYKTIIAR
ncbi:uncharacterized protein RAG0_17814 [Rhynchosporium agropyri]|uniref:Uncharacterized protein n=1 Tax=Rhynchosporium agropyri TaxID=914238 RepID=A0A1E1LU38_9HELO|nr:uncharacterized protein RAG0_17814 [Rhynchosporium agropyri]